MQLNAFPRCCGILIISHFGGSGTNGDSNQTDTSIDLYLTDNKNNMDSYALTMVSLNERQEKQLDPLLRKHGFVRSTKPSYHKKHDSFISVYTRRTVPLKKGKEA